MSSWLRILLILWELGVEEREARLKLGLYFQKSTCSSTQQDEKKWALWKNTWPTSPELCSTRLSPNLHIRIFSGSSVTPISLVCHRKRIIVTWFLGTCTCKNLMLKQFMGKMSKGVSGMGLRLTVVIYSPLCQLITEYAALSIHEQFSGKD